MTTVNDRSKNTNHKHTPGPLNPANYNGRVFIEDANGENVAEMLGVADQGRMHADARLFCAAPDLLAACDSAVQIIEQLIPEPSARGVADVVLFQLRDAIAKAASKNGGVA